MLFEDFDTVRYMSCGRVGCDMKIFALIVLLGEWLDEQNVFSMAVFSVGCSNSLILVLLYLSLSSISSVYVSNSNAFYKLSIR